MRTQLVTVVLCGFVLCLPGMAGAQREAVKNKAGDASATKADPPAHAKTHAPGTGKGDANGSAASSGRAGADANAKSDDSKAGDSKDIDGKAGEGKAGDSKDGDGKAGDGKGEGGRGGRHGGGAGGDEKEQLAYDFGLPTADGKNLPLSEYKGKVLLIVNLGRQSSYATQLAGLVKLNDSFKSKGLVVLGVPSDDFGNAEPGTPAEIAKFYTDAKVDFPVMEVSALTGVHELPLFTYLAKNKAIPDDGLHWNYTKFLVDRKGKVIVRFPPEVEPDSLELMATVQEALDGTWKPKKPGGEGGGRRGGGGDDSE